VTVAFSGQSKTATADGNGKWQIALDPMPASNRPQTLAVSSASPESRISNPESRLSHLESSNILVGEVWLCSGQSNMQWPVKKSANAAAEIAAANFPQIRMFTVKPVVAGEPQADVKGQWDICSPDTVGNFSAVAYFFGREIHKRRKVPVGLVHASQGWTPIEAWTPREALLGEPETAYIVQRWDRVCDPTAQAADKAARAEWDRLNKERKAQGKDPLPRPKPLGDPGFIHRASGLWNGAVAPLTACALRGVVWYQGETNERRGYRYRIEFPLLIASWRAAWERPDLPFLFVQVANVLPPDPVPVESEWAELRESQALALKLPHTGMAVTIDIGEEQDVHPKNKQDVGYRLGLQARARVYGEEIPHNSPMFKSMAIEGTRVRVQFEHTHGGLKTKDGSSPEGFAVAGEDRKYVCANAKIEDEAVVVSSDQVAAPVAVRYAWANNPAGCNLYNAADLPAVPFRTDSWPAKTQNAKGLVIDDMWK
jgi:sialate O-acetylesterase